MESKRWDVVVFDYGRVLSLAPTLAEREEFAALVGVAEPPFFQLYSDTRDEYDCGRDDCVQHWQRFADAAAVSISPAQLARVLELETRMWLRVNPDALALAREIKTSGMRTAILSNMPPDLLCDLRKSFDWLDEFEVQIWSCEHGVIKPDQAIYRICLDALGCEPHRALFFDDRPNNVEGARQAGMEAHVFESVEQAREIVSAALNSTREAVR
ncbi:MAG: HAD family phosphatase [Candidatus Korobacteraceae bacterium]